MNNIPMEFIIVGILALAIIASIIVVIVIAFQIRTKKRDLQLLAAAAGSGKEQAQVVVNTMTADGQAQGMPQYVFVGNSMQEEEDLFDTTILGEEDEDLFDTEEYIEATEDQIIAVPAAIPAVKSDDAVVIKSVPRKTFAEAYEELSRVQKSFIDELLEHAMEQENAKEIRGSKNVVVKVKSFLLIKLLIRRGTAVASFMIENDLLARYRKNVQKTEGTKIAVKATEVPLYDVNSFEAAKGMIDVANEQIKRDIEQAAEEKRERRRLARLEKKATAKEPA